MKMLKKEKAEEDKKALERQLAISGYKPYEETKEYNPYDEVIDLKDAGKYVKPAKPYEVEKYKHESMTRPLELESMKADIAAKQALAKYREQAKQQKVNPSEMSTKDILKAINDIDKASLYLDEDQQINTLAVKNQLLDEYYKRSGSARPTAPAPVVKPKTGIFGAIGDYMKSITPKIGSKQGGKLMIDKDGNKAYVYPDGTIEEVR
jgi:hypothetical protein